jgi:hypothetical protein
MGYRPYSVLDFTENIRLSPRKRVCESRLSLLPCYDIFSMIQLSEADSMTRKWDIAGRRWGAVLLVFNLVGAVIYVYRASYGWVLPQERELHSVTGEPYIWAAAVFPVCVVFFVLNLTWAAFILARKQWRTGILWLSTIPIWLVAAAIDFAHH